MTGGGKGKPGPPGRPLSSAEPPARADDNPREQGERRVQGSTRESESPSAHETAARKPRHDAFEPGNIVALRHGAYSPRAIAAKAAEVHAALLEAAPYLDQPRFLPAANRYLEAAAREALLHAHIVAVSAEKGPGGVPSRVWEQATAAARLAARLGSDLGLDPIGHARIRALSSGAEATEASLVGRLAAAAAKNAEAGA